PYQIVEVLRIKESFRQLLKSRLAYVEYSLPYTLQKAMRVLRFHQQKEVCFEYLWHQNGSPIITTPAPCFPKSCMHGWPLYSKLLLSSFHSPDSDIPSYSNLE